MRNSKINDTELRRMLDRGKTQKECAAYFECSRAAVSMRVKALKLNIARNVGLERADQICEKKIDAMGELHKINNVVSGELDWLTETMQKLEETGQLTAGVRLKIQKQMIDHTAEIRQQIRLMLEIAKVLYDAEAVRDFQREVIEAIAEAAPEIREQIVQRLHERRAIRSTTLTPGEMFR